MNRSKADLVWRLLTTAVVDVLNPLLLLSLALHVSLGYILSLLFPVTVEIWVALFWATLALPLIVLLANAGRRWNGARKSAESFTGRSLLPLIPLLVVIPAFGAEFAHPTMQVTHHGDIHLAYIHQLLYESTPVENVFAAGFSAGYHWLYHAWLTPMVAITGFSPPSLSSLSNVIAVLSSFVWIGKTLQLLRLGRSGTLQFGFMVLLVYFSVNISSGLSLLAQVVNGTYAPYSYDIILLDGASAHLHSVLAKVMNFQSMTLGIMLFAAAVYACTKLVVEGANLGALTILSASGIAALAVREIAALYIVVLLLGGFALLIMVEWLRSKDKGGYLRKFWRETIVKITPIRLAAWLALSLVLSLPLVHYNLDIVGSFNAGRPYGLSLANVRMIIAALLLFLALFIPQSVWALTGGKRKQLYILLCCLIGLLLTTILTLPDANQYKGVYFLAQLVAIAALFALQNMETGRSGLFRQGARAIAAIFYALVMVQILYVTGNFWNKVTSYGDGGYRFVGAHVEHASDVDGRLPAYLWIRDHSPVDALVVLELAPGKYSNLFHERKFYVRILQTHFAASDLPYHERVNALDLIYDEATSRDDFRAVLELMQRDLPGRSFYALIKDAEVSKEAMAERGAELVFADESGGANVYLLNPNQQWYGE